MGHIFVHQGAGLVVSVPLAPVARSNRVQFGEGRFPFKVHAKLRRKTAAARHGNELLTNYEDEVALDLFRQFDADSSGGVDEVCLRCACAFRIWAIGGSN